MFVDSHCHLDRVDLAPYDGDFARFVAETREDAVDQMLCVSIDLEHWPAMRDLVADQPLIAISVGVHPTEQDGEDPSVERLCELAENPVVVAIGETGLDYHWVPGGADWQRDRFRTHIRAARQTGKPLIIHTRDARDDTIAIMREESAQQAGGVMHCFTETQEMADAALALDFHISFSGIVTFKNAADLREVATRVPDERLLIETDSPYLSPVPYRGKPNEPRRVRHVAECLAELRGTDVESLAALTSENYRRLFQHPLP